MKEEKASPLLYSILTLLMFVPLFYINIVYRPFYYTKFFLISLGLLTLIIYAIVKNIKIVIPKPFLFQLLIFSPFLIRWVFTPFPIFSLFFTLFFLFYALFPIILFSIEEKIRISKNFLIWVWVVITQIFGLFVILVYLRVPFIISLTKLFGMFGYIDVNGKLSIFGGNPNYSAEFLAFSFISFVVIFFHEKVKFSFITNAFLDLSMKFFVLLVLFFALLFLASRASLGALFAGLILFVLLIVRKNKIYFLTILLLIVLLISLLSIPYFRTHLPEKLQNITNLKRLYSDIQLRIFNWKIAWYMGTENPLVGKGPGMFRVELSSEAKKLKNQKGLNLVNYLFFPNGKPISSFDVHNDPLEFWAEGGVFLLAYFLFFFYILWSVNAEKFFWDKVISLIPFFVLYLNSLFGFPFHLAIIFPFFGIYIFLLRENKAQLSIAFHKLTRYLVLSLAVLFFWISLQFLIGDYFLFKGIEKNSMPILKKVLLFNPVEVNAREKLYNLSLQKKLPPNQIADYLADYLKFVDSPKYRFYLANLLEKAGEHKEAIVNLKIALSLWDRNPDAYIYYYKLGYNYYRGPKNLDKAIEFTEKSIERNKKDIETKISAYINLAVLYRMQKNYKKALDAVLHAKTLILGLKKKDKKREEYLKKVEGLDKFIEELKKICNFSLRSSY